MRFVATVLTVQTVLIVALLVKIMMLEDRVGAAVADESTVTSGHADSVSTRNATIEGSAPLSEDRLRHIVREEFDRKLQEFAIGAREAAPDDRTNPASSTTSEMQQSNRDPYAADQVERRIDYFVGVGTISDADMLQLQSEIAKLNEADRSRMLAKLVAALNSGQLDGRP